MSTNIDHSVVLNGFTQMIRIGVDVMTSAGMRRDGESVGTLIRLTEGAALAGLHPATLRRWISQGKLAGWRLPSGQIRVDRAEILQLAKPMPTTVEFDHKGRV
ncbi:helix-turn-helix domain-containing protein [Nocardia beijingensis]|uniref:helix-turn-helix domain-containing protein n=1 Tax=Nocardia sp. NPDC019255 TaxID=3154591 RepID=UPI003400D01A